MGNELRPDLYMEKLLGWARKFGGTVSLGISNAGPTLLGEWNLRYVTIFWLWTAGEGFRKGIMASACLEGRHQCLLVFQQRLSSC